MVLGLCSVIFCFKKNKWFKNIFQLNIFHLEKINGVFKGIYRKFQKSSGISAIPGKRKMFCIQNNFLVILSNFLARKKMHNFHLPDALQINEKLSGGAPASLQRLNFGTIFKTLHKVPLSGQDRLPHWIFADPWATANVSICLRKFFLIILSNFWTRKKLHKFHLWNY